MSWRAFSFPPQTPSQGRWFAELRGWVVVVNRRSPRARGAASERGLRHLALSLGKHRNLSEPTPVITLILKPLAECLNFVHRVRRKEVIDRDVRRRHQD